MIVLAKKARKFMTLYTITKVHVFLEISHSPLRSCKGQKIMWTSALHAALPKLQFEIIVFFVVAFLFSFELQ